MPASRASASWLMPFAVRHRRSAVPNAVGAFPSGNPSSVFMAIPDDRATGAPVAITCQVKTPIAGRRFSVEASGGFLDVNEIGLDHQQVALARFADDAEQAIHLDDFFELLVDEPLQEALGEVVVLLHRNVHERGDLTRDLLLPVQRGLNGLFGRLERR